MNPENRYTRYESSHFYLNFALYDIFIETIGGCGAGIFKIAGYR